MHTFKAISKKAVSLAAVLVLALSCLTFYGCGSSTSTSLTSSEASNSSSSKAEQTTAAAEETTAAAAEFEYDGAKTNVEITVKDFGKIDLELYDELAPITVENFKKLVNEKFYDGLTFHRIIEGFMIQGGDPLGNGTGGSDEEIKGEFSANGVQNDLSHTRGVISMARSQLNDSASSQFFIVHQDSTFLDGQYAAFGKVTEGMDVVDKIAESTPVTDGNGTVEKANQPVIETIRVID